MRLQQLGALPLLPEPGLGDDQERLGYDKVGGIAEPRRGKAFLLSLTAACAALLWLYLPWRRV